MKKIKKNTEPSLGKGNASERYWLVCLCSLILFFVYFFSFTGTWGLSFSSPTLIKLQASMPFCYFSAIAVLALSFLLFRFLFSCQAMQKGPLFFAKPLSKRARYLVFGGVSLGLIAFMVLYLFLTEAAEKVWSVNLAALLWYQLPIGLVFCVLLFFVAWNVWHLYRETALPVSLAYLSYAIVTVVCFYALLFYREPDVYHGAAYTESITNVLAGVPYNVYTTGVYGHYGIFMALLTKLLGGDAIALHRAIALVGAIIVVLCAYVIHQLIRKNLIRILAIFTSMTTIVCYNRTTNYWQLQPHRILFPVVLLAYVVWMAKKQKFRRAWILLGFGICLLGIVWNTETGLFVLLGYLFALILQLWQRERWYSANAWRQYAEWAALSVAAFIGAIVFVNVYNLICGGTWIFQDFFFPLMDKKYMNGDLATLVPGGFQVWYLVIILFAFMIFFGLYHSKLVRKDETNFDSFAPAYIALGVIAILAVSYYLNRSAYLNLDICIQLAAIAMGIIACRFSSVWIHIKDQKETMSRVLSGALSFVCVLVLTATSLQNLAIGSDFSHKAMRNDWNRQLFLQETEQFHQILPDDNYIVFGNYANMYMLQGGRTSVKHYRDFSDINIGSVSVQDRIVEDVLAHGKFAVYLSDTWGATTTLDLAERILESGEFEEVSRGMVGDFELVCYEKK